MITTFTTESINEFERHVLACLVDSAIHERQAGCDGWVKPESPPDNWAAALDRLVELDLAEHTDAQPGWYRVSEAGESLLAQIEAAENTSQ